MVSLIFCDAQACKVTPCGLVVLLRANIRGSIIAMIAQSKDGTMRSLISLVSVLSVCLVSCQSSTPSTDQDHANTIAAPRPKKNTPTPPKISPWAKTLKAVSTIRDRPWKTPVQVEAVDVATLPAPASTRTPLKLERQALGKMLFAQEKTFAQTPWVLHGIARADLKRNVIQYAAKHPDREMIERAIFFAGVEALDGQYDARRPLPKSFDAHQAYEIARLASPMFSLALRELQTKQPTLTASTLAQRPELIYKHGWLGESLIKFAKQSSWSGHLDAHRIKHGLGLASVMFRAQGWSGVELIRSQLPQSAQALAQPEPWMRGQATPNWAWDDGWSRQMGQAGWFVEQRGRLGPIVFSYWLSQINKGRTNENMAFTLGTRTDQYVVYRKQNQRALIWLIQWSTPSIAQIATKQFKTLDPKMGDATSTRQLDVYQKGLMTALVLRDKATTLPNSIDNVLKTRIKYGTSDHFPLKYKAALMERWILGAQSSTFDKKARRWVDPSMKLQADLGILPKSWKVQLNRRGPLRWYARYKGEMLQLVIDLAKPLEHQFASKAYSIQLKKNLTAGLEQAKVTHFKSIKHPLGPAYELTIAGQLKGKPKQLSVWHIATSDGALLTLSATADPKQHATASQYAAKVLKSLSTTASAPKGTGIKQFKVEP